MGDTGELYWKNKYLTDEWGKILYSDAETPAISGKDGEVPARIEARTMLNPRWDPKREYVSRLKRPEWVCVGLLGKLLVRGDGTCVPGGYCMPNAQGCATAAASGYRVLGRKGENQVRIMMK